MQYIYWQFFLFSLIQVEYAKDFSDVNKPRAWSKYAKDSTAFQKTQKTTKDDEDKTSKKQVNNDLISLIVFITSLGGQKLQICYF